MLIVSDVCHLILFVILLWLLDMTFIPIWWWSPFGDYVHIWFLVCHLWCLPQCPLLSSPSLSQLWFTHFTPIHSSLTTMIYTLYSHSRLSHNYDLHTSLPSLLSHNYDLHTSLPSLLSLTTGIICSSLTFYKHWLPARARSTRAYIKDKSATPRACSRELQYVGVIAKKSTANFIYNFD